MNNELNNDPLQRPTLTHSDRIYPSKRMTDQEARYSLHGPKRYKHTSEIVEDIVVKSFKTTEIEFEYDYIKETNHIFKTDDRNKICRNIYIQMLDYKELIFKYKNNLYVGILHEDEILTEEEKEIKINVLREKIQVLESLSAKYMFC